MRINQNIAAFNAYNNLNNTQNRLSGSLEKLSSGFRINRAADDASGLVNSENLRSQIGGLKVATRNAQDAISLVQTAEGAQTEVHSILQRMRDLAVEAGNTGTNDDVSLAANQAEITELQKELDRISSDTQFGTLEVFTAFQAMSAVATITAETVDLTFTAAAGTGAVTAQSARAASIQLDGFTNINSGSAETVDLTIQHASLGSDGVTVEIAAGNADSFTAIADAINTTGGLEGFNAVAEGGDGQPGNTTHVVLTGPESDGAITFEVAQTNEADPDPAVSSSESVAGQTFREAASATATQLTLDVSDGLGVPSGYVGNVELTLDGGGLGSEVEVTVAAGATVQKIADAFNEELGTGFAAAVDGDNVVITGALEESATFTLTADPVSQDAIPAGAGALFQIGANEDQTETVFIDGVSAEALNVDAIDVTEDAGGAITAIDQAIADVSANRADLGAFQNRMESLTRNLGVAVENLSAAESRIRDTDMALEMVEFTRNQILSQAGTAMLAQANVVPQSVLSLLG